MAADSTVEEAAQRRGDRGAGRGEPGALLVSSGGAPRFVPIRIPGGRLALGRDELVDLGVHDTRVSRQHLTIEVGPDALIVSDGGSRNGTSLDGDPLQGSRTLSRLSLPSLVRIGQTLLLLVDDVSPHLAAGVRDGPDGVAGASLIALHEKVAALAAARESVLLTGESGSGKEVAARVYHRHTARPSGPFVAVNCATIPRELAERLFFGAVKGAYSGADADSTGYVQAAHGGTLFLDELGEIDLGVQAKLLRVIETREVTPLGATTATTVDLRLCAATSRDLRADIEAGRFREDLYYRIGRPALSVPPLRKRREEIPWLIARAISSVPDTRASSAFVEACMLKPWPGNVRELLTEARVAAVMAKAESASEVEPEHLAEEAGRELGPAARARLGEEEERLREALAAEKGNVKRAAERAGVSRSRMRRAIEKHGLAADLPKRR